MCRLYIKYYKLLSHDKTHTHTHTHKKLSGSRSWSYNPANTKSMILSQLRIQSVSLNVSQCLVTSLHRKGAPARISHGSYCGHDSDKRDDLNFLSLQYFYPSPTKMFSVILLCSSSSLTLPVAHIIVLLVKKCSCQITNTILFLYVYRAVWYTTKDVLACRQWVSS